jgi:hypothetical protein
MADYLLIESRDPFGGGGAVGEGAAASLAKGLAAQGHKVTLFLVQNGVLPARPCQAAKVLADAAAAGVEVLADEFSLRERGIERLAPGVKKAPLDVVVDQLAAGRKAIWH